MAKSNTNSNASTKLGPLSRDQWTDIAIAILTTGVVWLLGYIASAPWVLWFPLGIVAVVAFLHFRHTPRSQAKSQTVGRLKTAVGICVAAIILEITGVIYWHYNASAPKILAEKDATIQRRTEDRDDAITAKKSAENRLVADTLAWEKERGELNARIATLEQEKAANAEALTKIQALNDTLTVEIDDRARRAALRQRCAQWLPKLSSLREQVRTDSGVTEDEWAAFAKEFLSFAKQELAPDQLALLDSSANVVLQGAVWPSGLQGKDEEETKRRRARYQILHRWESRLVEIIYSLYSP